MNSNASNVGYIISLMDGTEWNISHLFVHMLYMSYQLLID